MIASIAIDKTIYIFIEMGQTVGNSKNRIELQ